VPDPKCKERFPITVLFNGLPPIGSVGYVVRLAIGELHDLNGLYRLNGSGIYEQYLGQGFLRSTDGGWSLYRRPRESQSEPTLVARAELGKGEQEKPPVGHWQLETPFKDVLSTSCIEVMVVAFERHVLGNIDFLTLAKAALVLGHIAEEADEAAVDAACLISTTNLGYFHCVEQVLGAVIRLVPVDSGSANALALGCDFASHHDAGVRETASGLILKVARPEDLSTIKARLAHGAGQHRRVLAELDRKFLGLPVGDAFTDVEKT